jgi:DNA-binding NtrC family response regulator
MSGATHILIIDDEPNLRLMFRTVLESAGYHVAEASDGTHGLEQLRRSPADLVLLDLRMPGIDGMAVLRQLRGAGNPVPVIIITAHGSIPDAVGAMRLGAIDFLSKPVTPDVLRTVVAQVIERHAGDTPGTTPAPSGPAPEAVTLVEGLRRAKLALNRCEFDEAESLLMKAIALEPTSAEARSLGQTLQECRKRQEDGPYRIIRELCG